MARPTKYTKKLGIDICQELAEGASLASICRKDKYPNISTVLRWAIKDEEFRDMYKEARDMQMDVHVDKLAELAETTEDVQRARLIIDTHKWTASKLKPRKYGDKSVITTEDEKGNVLPITGMVIKKD